MALIDITEIDFGAPPGPSAALPPGSWQLPGQPQQNLPFDNPVAANTLGFDTTQGRNPIPFWGVAPATLDPSNSQFPAWDVVRLAGQVLPGLCGIRGGRAQRIDIKKSKGQNFGTLTSQGYDPAEITITERIWTPQQLSALWVMMPILEPLFAASGIVQAVDVYHPALALRSITSVIIKKIGVLKPSSIKEVWEQDIELIEYRPTKKKQNVTSTIIGSTPIALTGVNTQSKISAPAKPSLPGSNKKFVGPNGGIGG